ncbi:sensor histidine kinase [Paenibacillus sp. FSL H8-0537]|uniref:sensor histidine kinase n=1 Tax=Paenibacillus sp. FSL H8-0537 TaxID=2921399 RepID=UPI0031011D65
MAIYRNLSIKRKMFLMVFLIMTLIITIAYSSLYYAYSIYDKQLYDKSYRLLNLSSTTVDMELKKLESMSLTIIADSQIQQGLKDLLQDDAEYTGYMTRKKITDQLWTHISTAERYVQSVHLIDSRQMVSKYGESPSFSEEKYAHMMKEAVAGKGEVRWLYPDDSDPMLIMVREVRAYEPLTLAPIGILFLRINMERLVEDYAGTASHSSDILLKAGEEVVYPYGQMPEGVAEALQPLQAGDGYEIKKVNSETTFLSQRKSSYTGWMYYNIVPYNHIFETVVWLKNLLVIVYGLTFVVVVAIGMAFARSLTRPIRQLIGQMKEVQYGDLDSMDASMTAPSFQQMDEVGLLQRTYRMMITRINTLIKENYASQLIIKETEFKALQAQINPHFLYNALDSIHWLAKKNAQQQISSMVVSLGYLLRSSISLKQNVITVAEELETVKHYITIQKYRFQNRLDFHMDVPASCHAAAIPKLTLQPLLENAVQYGLEPMIEPCTIRLYAEWAEGKLALIVEDCGPGMEEAYAQRVLSGEAEARGNGIGILNIKNRIKLAFGESYGLRIDSRAGGGTKVSVLIPLLQGDEAEDANDDPN